MPYRPHVGGHDARRLVMTLCPIALAVGCQKCPAFSICPLKTVIGDQKKPDAATAKPGDKKGS
jgi:hypothetical protein